MAHRRLITAATLLALAALVAIPALADYLGPNRTVTTWVWRRLRCHYEAVYDPPGAGWYGCTLDLYETPDSSCPSSSSVADLFTTSSCGWAQPYCQLYDCSISRSGSTESCSEGQTGCRAVEQHTTLPEATVSGSVTCGSPGSNGWCRGGAALELSGSEPVSGYSILALEGTHNGAPLACSGSSCSVGLVEGVNDFSFWAISSFGDSSRMGSASGRLDSQAPALSGSASGTPGDNGWYVSDVTITASASDPSPGSGLASLEVQVDGGGWGAYGDPLTLGDGTHTVELRALDGAGHAANESVSVAIDSVAPVVALNATASFCPGCGQTGDITLSVQDGGSGIASWSLTGGGVAVASGSGSASETIAWDGSGLGGGTHTLTLAGQDQAGNVGQATTSVTLVLPTPVPTSPPPAPPPGNSRPPPAPSFPTSTAPSTLEAEPTSTASAPGLPPRPTATARSYTFGVIPAAPAEGESGESFVPEAGPPAAAPGSSSNVLYGAAALAVIGTATAAALEAARRRKEEEERQRAEMAMRNAQAEAREQAERQRLAALYAAVAAAGAEVTRREAERRRLERKEELLEPQILPVDQVPTVAAVPPGRSLSEVAEARDGIAQPQPQAADTPWWQRAADWVDQHQAVAAIGIGLAVGLAAAAIIVTGGASAPLVLGVGALVAGGLTAGGTVALNAHCARPLGQNVARNVVYSVASEVLVAGAGTAIATGWAGKAVLGAGNAVVGVCARHAALCTRIEPVLRVADQVEEWTLSVQLAVQTARRDPSAGETALELQLERMDGGVPGNAAIRELREEFVDVVASHGDEGAQFLTRLGDEANDLIERHGEDILNVFERYGDEAVSLVQTESHSPGTAQRLVAMLEGGSPAPDHWSAYVPEGLGEDIVAAFDGEPIPVVLGADARAFRYWSDPRTERGHWLTLDPGLSPDEARSALALPGTNAATHVSEFRLPEGTVVFVGRARPQTSASWAGGYAIGGGLQLYMPDDKALLPAVGP